jgi:16S rRNA (uracil1498-N3)-methyltransferase
MNIFYCPHAQQRSTVFLDEQESHHAYVVLRLREGTKIHVFDGKGQLFSAVVLSANKKEVYIEITELIRQQMPPYYLQIAIAPTKQMERFEWFVEKAVELGVSKITPVICERSERRELKKGRLEKLIVAACKQSKQLWLPAVDSALHFKEFFETELPENRWVSWCENRFAPAHDIHSLRSPSVFLIGPEGDFSEKEIIIAKKHRFKEYSLGSQSVLRTETAGVYVAAMFRMAIGQ